MRPALPSPPCRLPAHRILGIAPLAGLAILPAWAQPADQAPWRAGVTVESSHLDRGLGNWSGEQLRLGRHWSSRQVLELEATRTRRYGQQDAELAASGAWPLGETLTATARVAHSPTHRVLARDTLRAGLQWEWRRAWLLHGGLRHTRYTSTRVEQATLGVEHYFGDFGATVLAHRASGLGSTTHAGELRLAWYPSESTSIRLFAGHGDEATALGGGAVVLARVRSLAVGGRHPVGAGWSLDWGLHRIQQGDFHRRVGGSLGVQRAF